MKEVNLTEHNLVQGCIKGDRQSQEALYRKFASEMYSVCLAYERDRDAAKDILQAAFLKVFRSIDKYGFKGSLKAWVRRIITNTAIDHYRKKKKDDVVEYNDEVYELDEAEEQEVDLTQENYKRILDEVGKLPSGARVVFNLYALEGLTHQEISDELNISVGTSKSQLNRAKKILKEVLKSA